VGSRRKRFSCKNLTALVTERLEGSLSPEARASYDDHLAGCRNCRVHVDQMRATIALAAGQKPQPGVSEATKTTLLDSFRKTHARAGTD
jgi:anti-sigma factor RsiW